MDDKWTPADVRPRPGESLESWAWRGLWAEVRGMREAFASMIAEVREAARRDLESERRMRESDRRRPRKRELHRLVGDDPSGWPDHLRP